LVKGHLHPKKAGGITEFSYVPGQWAVGTQTNFKYTVTQENEIKN